MQQFLHQYMQQHNRDGGQRRRHNGQLDRAIAKCGAALPCCWRRQRVTAARCRPMDSRTVALGRWWCNAYCGAAIAMLLAVAMGNSVQTSTQRELMMAVQLLCGTLETAQLTAGRPRWVTVAALRGDATTSLGKQEEGGALRGDVNVPHSCLPRLVVASPCRHHHLSMCQLVVTLPLIAPPSHLPGLVFPSPLVAPPPLNASAMLMGHPLVCPGWLSRHLANATIAHCHCPAVHCAVAEVAHSNHAAIIDSLRVDVWPLLPIAAADNMAIVAPHSAIAQPSHHPLCRRRCRPSRL